MDIKDRIQKLLALSVNPNENEAKAALLKAQELMAKHKLSMADFETAPESEVVQYNTGIQCSKRKNEWVVALADVLAAHYCCRSYRTRKKGKQINTIMLTGFSEDAEVCTGIIKYAIACINTWIIQMEKKLPEKTTLYVRRSVRDSYAYGYIRGIKSALKQQREKHQEWGLVLVVPQEANAFVADMKKASFHGKSVHIPSVYNEGFRDGVKFAPDNMLPGKDTAYGLYSAQKQCGQHLQAIHYKNRAGEGTPLTGLVFISTDPVRAEYMRHHTAASRFVFPASGDKICAADDVDRQ